MRLRVDHISAQKYRLKRLLEEIGEEVFLKVGLDGEGVQKLFDNEDEFRESVIGLVRRLSRYNEFYSEQVFSSKIYMFLRKTVPEQVKILARFFPGIGVCDNLELVSRFCSQTYIDRIDSYFVVPRWDEIMSTYEEAVRMIIDALKFSRGKEFFRDHYEGQLGLQYLRRSRKIMRFFERITAWQDKGKALVLPAQLGIQHRGRSIRRAREVMDQYEFPLGAFEIGVILLTHPERLQSENDLAIDCAGDEYSPGANFLSHAPCFYFKDGKLCFGPRWYDEASRSCGSASGFLLG